MVEEEDYVNPVHERFNSMTKEIEKTIDEVCTKFFKETPTPEEFKISPVGPTVGIAQAQGGYQLRYRQAQAKLELYKAQHAKVLHIVRAYHMIDTTVLDNDRAKKWGYVDGCRDAKAMKPLKPDLDYHVQADELYIAATRMLAAQQRLVDTYKDIDSKLIERGRQYKTAMELMRFTNGA